eukprot:5141072-Pleurochrysis_carterae.AAC.1
MPDDPAVDAFAKQIYTTRLQKQSSSSLRKQHLTHSNSRTQLHGSSAIRRDGSSAHMPGHCMPPPVRLERSSSSLFGFTQPPASPAGADFAYCAASLPARGHAGSPQHTLRQASSADMRLCAPSSPQPRDDAVRTDGQVGARQQQPTATKVASSPLRIKRGVSSVSEPACTALLAEAALAAGGEASDAPVAEKERACDPAEVSAIKQRIEELIRRYDEGAALIDALEDDGMSAAEVRQLMSDMLSDFKRVAGIRTETLSDAHKGLTDVEVYPSQRPRAWLSKPLDLLSCSRRHT